MSLPKIFISKIEARLGEEAPAFFNALNNKVPVSIRINPRKGKHLFSDEEPVPWCEYGKYLKERPAFVFDPLYHAGAYYAQEASSMFFANVIDFSKDLKVLDLCAAPGGKSSLLLSFLSKGSLLVSNEMVGKRNSILQENLIKWGYPNLIITKNKAEDFSGLIGFFDVILVDAPCSGEGMFRKDQDAIAQWSEGLVAQCSAIQEHILEQAIPLLAPDGILVYSTCTFEADENENHFQKLYQSHGDALMPLEISSAADWGMTEIEVIEDDKIQKGYYCFPHKVKGEGLFVAALRSQFNSNVYHGKPAKTSLRKPNASELEIINQFIGEAISFNIYIDHEQVYLLPKHLEVDMLFLRSKLEIKKLGIQAGVLIRGVFIPDHDLAMSGLYDLSIPCVALDQRKALEYQQRQAMPPVEGLAKGWFLYTYQGVALGWAKNIGNRINNHYPAEWRIRKTLEKD